MNIISTISFGLLFGFAVVVMHEVLKVEYWKLIVYGVLGILTWYGLGRLANKSETVRNKDPHTDPKRYKEWEELD